MKAVLRAIKKDKILLKILEFFFNNPTCIDTAGNIAQWIGEEKKKVEKKISYLVKHKILNRDATYAVESFSYTQDKDLNMKIAQFLKELKDE